MTNKTKTSNLNLIFGAGETARLFKVEVDVIKDWAYNFKEYLSDNSNPNKKGHVRQFTVDDLRVFAYVSFYWEDDPDIDCIKYGLNKSSQYEPPYSELILSIVPLYTDIPENIEEYVGPGVLIGGMAEFADIMNLAHSYKRAGDILLDVALKNDEKRELAYPIIYNYRHATELYLKAALGKWKIGHELSPLIQRFKQLIKKEYNASIPQWFENLIIAFNDLDPTGSQFRYGGKLFKDEVFIDLEHLKKLMGWFSETFKKIESHQRYGRVM